MPLDTPETAEETMPEASFVDSASGFQPLRISLFRYRWIASMVSNIGTWMQDTAGTWLMTELTTSPLRIALMQTATSLPVLILGLLAGATADIFDRRRLLIFWQAWMLGTVAVLAVLTFLGHVSPWLLLGFTFLLNSGRAMNNPAWQAIVPELVPRRLVPDAVSLNSAGNNLARAIGPALGGLMVAAFQRVDRGAGTVFALNAVSFAGVIWVLMNWKRVPLFKSALPSERLTGSILSGLRYVRYAPQLQSVLLRAFTYSFFVSAVWALLAVVARHDLRQGALGYGILNGAMGLGAASAATILGRIRRRFSANTILASSTLYSACTLVVLGHIRTPWIVISVLVFQGFAWTSSMSTLNAAVQLSVPAWVQARALGAYLMVYQGGLAIGSVLWGALAENHRTSVALYAAAFGLLATLPLVHGFKVLQGPLLDHTPHRWHRPALDMPEDADATTGPVRISIEYTVAAHDYPAFTRAIHALRGARMRDGAIRWGIYRDAEDPEHLNETFLMESWIDFLRSRERVTEADAALRDTVYALHKGGGKPKVTHMVYVREVRSRRSARFSVDQEADR